MIEHCLNISKGGKTCESSVNKFLWLIVWNWKIPYYPEILFINTVRENKKLIYFCLQKTSFRLGNDLMNFTIPEIKNIVKPAVKN